MPRHNRAQRAEDGPSEGAGDQRVNRKGQMGSGPDAVTCEVKYLAHYSNCWCHFENFIFLYILSVNNVQD